MLSTGLVQVMRAVRRRGLPMVVDADGLWLVNQDISLVAGGWVVGGVERRWWVKGGGNL